MRAVFFSLLLVCFCAYVSGQTYTCSILNPLGTCPTGQTCLGILGCSGGGATDGTCNALNPAGFCPNGGICLGVLGCSGGTNTGGNTCSATNPAGTCPTGQTCLGILGCSKVDVSGSGSVNIGTCSPSCSAGQSCILGLCLRTTIPQCTGGCAANQYCYASGSSTSGSCQSLSYCGSAGCATGTTCVGGSCIPTPFGYGTTCSPTCRQGSECVLGRCVPTISGNCAACNATTQVCRSGSCVSSTNANSCPTTCTGTTFCNFGTCSSCGVLCSTNTNAGASASLNSAVLNAFMGAGLNFGNVVGNAFAQATAQALDGFNNIFQASVNQAITFNGTAATGSTPLVFPAGPTNPSFANIQAKIQFPALYVDSPAAIAIANGANFTAGNAQVNQRMDVAFDSGDAGSNGVRFDRLSAAAPIYFSGPGTVQFPARSQDAICKGAECSCNVAGGTRLTGNAGNLTLNIQATSTETARAFITAGNVLTAAGNILGSAGILDLAGELIASGGAVQPKVRVQAAGKLTIANTDVFTGGDVELSSGSTLKIGNGAKAYLQKLTCPTGASISATVPGTISTAAGGVFLNYAANTDISALRCSLVITDASGAAYALSNPNAGTVGRRLLGTSCTTTFGSTSAAYACSATGAANGITFSIAVVMASIIAALAAMF